MIRRNKFWLLALATLLSATGLFAHAQSEPMDGDDRRPFEMPVYRFFYPHNFQTTDYNQGVASGMNYVGISFYVMDRPWNDRMHPLFKCHNYINGDYMISTLESCEGYSNLGILGWVANNPNQRAGTPIYRCFGRGDHVATTNINECYQAQYQVEMILGYVVH